MPPPSKLTIATSAVQRLIKEEASYHKEIKQQEARITKLEGPSEDENAEFQLKQEKRGLEETHTVLASMKTKIQNATQQLEEQIADSEEGTPEITKAKETAAEAKKLV